MTEPRTCGLCGHAMTTTFGRCGVAWDQRDDERVWLCHADDHDCYRLWTVYEVRPPGQFATTEDVLAVSKINAERWADVLARLAEGPSPTTTTEGEL